MRTETPLPLVRPRGRRWWPRLLVGLGLALLVGTLLLAGLMSSARDPAPLPVPSQMAGLPLQSHQFGSEAADAIRRLHRTPFPLTGAAVAIYGTDSPSATLWVARSWRIWGARLLTAWMTRAIAGSDTPFTPVGSRREQGILVYELTGIGQTHFYFQAGDRVYWLAVAPDRADQGLRDLLGFASDAAQVGRSVAD